MKFYKEAFPYYDKTYLFIDGQESFLGRLLNNYPGKEFVKNADDFNVALVFLASFMISTDGERKDSEYSFIASYFTKVFDGDEKMGKEASRLAIYLLNESDYFDDMCEMIREYARKSGKLQLIDFLCDLAYADKEFHKNEHKYIQIIGFKIGLEKQEFMTIINSHISRRPQQTKQKPPDQSSANGKTKAKAKSKSSRKAAPTYTSSTRLSTACKILGVTQRCTEKELKKAYRKLARLHHPDKVAYLGKGHVKKARIRFAEISAANKYIKENRGF
ncbi:MAG: TerB family tellurite resistance protein [Flavobacteriales bacterium]|nr:TerB family tellurite resistance protein [Flavobacteriales bacterium]